jgi:hypothetical protein
VVEDLQLRYLSPAHGGNARGAESASCQQMSAVVRPGEVSSRLKCQVEFRIKPVLKEARSSP